MSIISKLIRQMVKSIETTRALIVRYYYHAKYPGCDLSGSSIGKRTTVVCTDGSRLELVKCNVSDGATIVADHGGSIYAKNCFFGRSSVIVAREKIEIGENTLISEMVVIRDQNHRFNDRPTPIAEQGFDSKPIVIGENTWIGAKATVLAGSTIGNETVIGAHALVNGDIPAGVLAVGTPAKMIRSLIDENLDTTA